MAKWQAKKVVDNQNLLIESSQHGGPDGLRDYYIQTGVQQERNKNLQIIGNIGKAILPFVVGFVSDRIVTWFEKRKNKRALKNADIRYA